MWVRADLNDPESTESEEIDLLMAKCRAAVSLGFLKLFRRLSPQDGWTGWHAPVGKNTSAAAAFLAEDNNEGGILVNMDNDNFVTESFFDDLLGNADGLSSGALKGLFFKHPQCQATTGRMACGMRVFHECGGYDESLEPLGYEDSSCHGHACAHSGVSLLC